VADTQSTHSLSHSRIVPLIVGLSEADHARLMGALEPGLEAFRQSLTDSSRTWMTLSGFSAEMLLAGRMVASLLDLIESGDLAIGGG